MEPVAETMEDRIRERAYYIWESSGRPIGRDEEFWRRACEMMAEERKPPSPAPRVRRPKQAQTARRSSRKPARPASSGAPAPAE
jgi:hypothetical protein